MFLRAVAPMAGVAYGCAIQCDGRCRLHERLQGRWASNSSSMRFREGYAGYTGPYPLVSIWQGTADVVVSPLNADEIARSGDRFTVRVYTRQRMRLSREAATSSTRTQNGKGVVEVWKLEGMVTAFPWIPTVREGRRAARAAPMPLTGTSGPLTGPQNSGGLLNPGDRSGGK